MANPVDISIILIFWTHSKKLIMSASLKHFSLCSMTFFLFSFFYDIIATKFLLASWATPQYNLLALFLLSNFEILAFLSMYRFSPLLFALGQSYYYITFLCQFSNLLSLLQAPKSNHLLDF